MPDDLEKPRQPQPRRTDTSAVLFEQTKMSAHSGPLPSPQMLAEYDRVHPGLAERIVTMAELQQRHRMNLETQHNSSEIAQSSRGQWFAFLLSLFNMITGIIFLYKGAPTQGATIITGTLVALAGVFLTGKYLQKKELEAKARIQSGQTPPKDSKKIQK